MLPYFKFQYGQRSKCADLSELLRNFPTRLGKRKRRRLQLLYKNDMINTENIRKIAYKLRSQKRNGYIQELPLVSMMRCTRNFRGS